MSTAAFPDDEFRFLRSDAARVGRTAPLPRVLRLSVPTTEGRSLSGLRFGGLEPPRLIALHGAGLNAHSFDPFLLALDVPALSLDLPGHGRSDWRSDADYRPESIAADVVTALQRFTDDGAIASRVAIVGHSLGGLAASLVAAALPNLVQQLTLVDITPDALTNGSSKSVREFVTGQREFDSIEEIVDRAIAFGIGSNRASLERGVALNTRRRSDGRLEWAHHLAHPDAFPGRESPERAESTANAGTGVVGGSGAGAAGDPRPRASLWTTLRSLEAPPALIRASLGMVTDELAEEWRRQLPLSELVSIEGPHNLHEAAPVELARAVENLIAKVE